MGFFVGCKYINSDDYYCHEAVVERREQARRRAEEAERRRRKKEKKARAQKLQLQKRRESELRESDRFVSQLSRQYAAGGNPDEPSFLYDRYGMDNAGSYQDETERHYSAARASSEKAPLLRRGRGPTRSVEWKRPEKCPASQCSRDAVNDRETVRASSDAGKCTVRLTRPL